MQLSNIFVLALSAVSAVALPTPDAEVSELVARANDYPYGGSCGAWRINDRKNIHFTNQYKGAHWGNANTWDSAAKSTGVTINSTPKVGSIAQTNAGSAGHVAWVSAVNGNDVTVEEYNYAVSEGYGKRTVSKGTFSYIHI